MDSDIFYCLSSIITALPSKEIVHTFRGLFAYFLLKNTFSSHKIVLILYPYDHGARLHDDN